MTIIEALSHVMADVGAVTKQDRNKAQGFNFRGIDAVVNAVSPALRNHGVVVTPRLIDHRQETMSTAKGAQMRSTVVIVEYTFHGPEGDTIVCCAAGEAFDSGDKSTPKAMSVAFRTALLQALCLPTDEPDPDASSYQIAEFDVKAWLGDKLDLFVAWSEDERRRQWVAAQNQVGMPTSPAIAERILDVMAEAYDAEG